MSLFDEFYVEINCPNCNAKVKNYGQTQIFNNGGMVQVYPWQHLATFWPYSWKQELLYGLHQLDQGKPEVVQHAISKNYWINLSLSCRSAVCLQHERDTHFYRHGFGFIFTVYAEIHHTGVYLGEVRLSPPPPYFLFV